MHRCPNILCYLFPCTNRYFIMISKQLMEESRPRRLPKSNTSMLGKSNKRAWSIPPGGKSTNHHCQWGSSRDKYFEVSPPRGNYKNKSKIDLAKQDLKAHNKKTLVFQHHHWRRKEILSSNEGPKISYCRRCHLYWRGDENKDGYPNPNVIWKYYFY
jgi:hypothetical protein